MRKLVAVALAACGLAGAADLAKLEFLAGCWETPPGGANPMRVDEHWSKPAGGNMLGYSRTFKGGRMVFFEFMRLEVKGDEVLYTPRIGVNAKLVSFRLIKASGSDVVFENAEHDFPQRILYRREGDKLFAAIEGKDKSKERREDFPYVRVACP